MKYIKLLVGVLAIMLTTFMCSATVAPSSFISSDDQWTLALAGGGSASTKANNSSTFGTELELGHTGTFIRPLEAGLRQGIGYSSGDTHKFKLSTHAFTDWSILKLGNIEFDTGVNIGANYGNTTLAWTVAPEVVGRLYLKKNLDVFVRSEYGFNLNDFSAQNNVNLTLGLHVKF